ncbi:phage major capsid protein [Bifidobacterium asteroides]|uniref:phage major capsid protein n=1 Tax=Bifidobacterium asteroides TaxID=1684 RepID=UPI00215D8D04|nr:phage major capsid protein [Bifidobacterium asteroides]
MVKAITDKADRLLLQGDEAGIKGLALTPDMIDAGDINAATGLNPLLNAIGKVGDNGGSPTGIIMGYSTWASLLKLTDRNDRPLIATDMANSPTPAIYGILIILNMQTSADTILLNDSSRVLSAASQAAVATSDQAYVANDSMAIRVTMRLGFGVLRPNRLARLTVNKTPAKQ